MKTSKLIVTLMGAALLLIAGNSFAAISGACVDCHSMHNSQNGSAVTFNGEANPILLMAGSCGGCHADPQASSLGQIPQVNTTPMSAAGSGGSFGWLNDAQNGGDAYGHNVADLAGPDQAFQALTDLPPGYTNNTTNGVNGDAATWSPSVQLTCGGINGCHGNPGAAGADVAGTAGEFASVKGAHHANIGNDGTTVLGTDQTATAQVGEGFRFLYQIAGIEMTGVDAPTLQNHNVYSGAVNGDDAATISALCARCHGKFHQRNQPTLSDGIGGSASPWLRHPTDIDMKDLAATSEYAAYNFQLEAPVAVTVANLQGMTNQSGAGDYDAKNEIVTCLSCHYAHGSDQPDLLRWDYDGMIANTGGTTGCFNCHTTK